MLLVGKRTNTAFTFWPHHIVGQGAEGVVYDAGAVCVKVFERFDEREQFKVEALSRFAQKVPGVAWPSELVIDNSTKAVCGFVMPRATGKTLEYHLDERETRNWSTETKIGIALNIATTIAAAHAIKSPTMALGDLIKSSNVVIDGTDVIFIDSNSVSIFRHRALDGTIIDSVSSVTTPGFTPREVLENPHALPSHAADRFALAVLLFELLFGRSPTEPKPSPASIGLNLDDAIRNGMFLRYTSHSGFVPPTYDDIDVPQEIDMLFRSAFLSPAHERPTPEAWLNSLKAWHRDLEPPVDRTEMLQGLRRQREMKRYAARALFAFSAFAAVHWLFATAATASESNKDIGYPTKDFQPVQVDQTLPALPRLAVGPACFKELF